MNGEHDPKDEVIHLIRNTQNTYPKDDGEYPSELYIKIGQLMGSYSIHGIGKFTQQLVKDKLYKLITCNPGCTKLLHPSVQRSLDHLFAEYTDAMEEPSEELINKLNNLP